MKSFAIVVLDRGFVYVGDVDDTSNKCIITNVFNIRKWGTTNGLGELSRNGPTEKTVLDPSETVEVPHHAVNHCIHTKFELWDSTCKRIKELKN